VFNAVLKDLCHCSLTYYVIKLKMNPFKSRNITSNMFPSGAVVFSVLFSLISLMNGGHVFVAGYSSSDLLPTDQLISLTKDNFFPHLVKSLSFFFNIDFSYGVEYKSVHVILTAVQKIIQLLYQQSYRSNVCNYVISPLTNLDTYILQNYKFFTS
jgi:hypothetical protein